MTQTSRWSTHLVKKGVSLVEVQIVIAIIAVLSALAHTAVAPGMKRKSREAEIKSSLRQFTSAINLYQADHNDVLPPSSAAFREYSREQLPPWRLDERYRYPATATSGHITFFYTMPLQVQQISAVASLNHEFDPAKNAIVKFPAWQKDRPEGASTTLKRTLYLGRARTPKEITVTSAMVLGSRLDGSVDWFHFREDFESEFVEYSHLSFLPR